MKAKIAQWKITGHSHTFHHTLTATLRSGAQGQGKVLGRFHYWANSQRSKEASDPIARKIEEDAWDAGYTIYGYWDPAALED